MNNEYVWYGNEYDEYTLDSLLYGVDYISTGSKPPLPPMVERKDSISSVSADKNSNLHAFQLDENGIYLQLSYKEVCRRTIIPTVGRDTRHPNRTELLRNTNMSLIHLCPCLDWW
jgi:hypothetical protein